MLMVVDGGLQRYEAAEALGFRPRVRLRMLRPGQVHQREGAVVNREYHRVAASTFDNWCQRMPCQLVTRADFAWASATSALPSCGSGRNHGSGGSRPALMRIRLASLDHWS